MIVESVDGKQFSISKENLRICLFFNEFFDGDVEDDLVFRIPYENATSLFVSKCIDFCNFYHSSTERPVFDKPLKKRFNQYVSDWYVNFFDMTEKDLVQLTKVVNWLNIPPLLEICVAKLADMVRFKSTPQLRELFEIESDFSPEEEEKIKKENEFIINYINN